MLASTTLHHPITSTPHDSKLSQHHHQRSTNIPRPHIPHLHAHQISDLVANFIAHLFAPVSYQQCTCSPYRIPDYTKSIIVDDEFVLMEETVDERDGGPLCREATIESWKVCGEGKESVMTKDRKRRLSVHCFGG